MFGKPCGGGTIKGDGMATLTKNRTLPNGKPNPIWYIRIWQPTYKRYKYISTRTKSEREAREKLRFINDNLWKSHADSVIVNMRKSTSIGSLNSLVKGEDLRLTVMIPKYMEHVSLRLNKDTVRSYELGMKALIDCFPPLTSLLDLSPTDMDVLLKYLKDRNIADGTINVRLRPIQAFFNWCVKMRHIDKAPFSVEFVSIDDKTHPFITPDEYKAILENIDREPIKSAIRIYAGTGLRKSELQPKERSTNNRYSVLEADGNFLRVFGKRNKERFVPLTNELVADYHKYIESGISVTVVSRAFTLARIKAGIAEREKTIHALRHTYAYRMLVESNNNMIKVRDLLGHSSVKMTEDYARVPMEYLKVVLGDKSGYVYA